jgi:hypothetical protein
VVAAGTVAGTTVTSGAGVWGADKEIIAAGLIVAEFWVCAMDIDTNSGAQPVVIELEIAGATSIFSARMDLTAVTSNIGRFAVPIPRRIPGSSQITARASGTGAKTYNVSVLVATGL